MHGIEGHEFRSGARVKGEPDTDERLPVELTANAETVPEPELETKAKLVDPRTIGARNSSCLRIRSKLTGSPGR